MGTVRPPPSDARMAAALMPIWSVTKLQTVLMDQTRCIVNNVSSSNSGLEHLVYAQEWAQYKLHLLTQCFLLPCILTADAAWTLFAVLPYLQVLLSPLLLLTATAACPAGMFLALSSLCLPVRLESLSSPPLPVFYLWMTSPALFIFGDGKISRYFSQFVQHLSPLNILTLC